MFTKVHPKLPMRNKAMTRQFYCEQLGFSELGVMDFPYYFMCEKEGIELHFFDFPALNPLENYGQIYVRTDDIETLHHNLKSKGMQVTALEEKPWLQKEFSILDPDHNLITFGQSIF